MVFENRDNTILVCSENYFYSLNLMFMCFSKQKRESNMCFMCFFFNFFNNDQTFSPLFSLIFLFFENKK